jgi:hypothetical protein
MSSESCIEVEYKREKYGIVLTVQGLFMDSQKDDNGQAKEHAPGCRFEVSHGQKVAYQKRVLCFVERIKF